MRTALRISVLAQIVGMILLVLLFKLIPIWTALVYLLGLFGGICYAKYGDD